MEKTKIFNKKEKIITFGLIAIIVLFAAFFVQYSLGLIQNEVKQNAMQKLEQTEKLIQYRMEYAEQVSDMIFGNSMVQSYLKTNLTQSDLTQSEKAEQFIEMDNLNSLIDTAEAGQHVKVEMYIPEEKFYSLERIRFFPIEEAGEEEWYGDLIENKGKMIWKYCEEEHTISSIRFLKDLEDYRRILGIIKVSITEEDLYSIVSATENDYNKLYIADDDYNLIFNNNGETFEDTLMDRIYEETSGSININSDGVDYVVFKEFEKTHWRIMAEIRHRYFVDTKNAVSIVLLLAIMLFLVSAVVVIIILSYFNALIAKKIKILMRNMESGKSEWSDEFRSSSGGLWGSLYNSVENTLLKLNDVYSDYYASLKREKIAEMKILQEQLNSHFLYNTLNMISWMTMKYNAVDIRSMIDSLAEYFRLSLGNGKSFATIENEIKQINIYAQIQKERYNDNAKIVIDIPEEMYGCVIPKNTFQPIVENALIHGIYNKENKSGTVTITAQWDNEYLIITVSDDGMGMDDETLEKIKSILSSREYNSESSYGLYNVHTRLKIFSGDDNCGISIETEYGKGTKVRIKVRKTFE